VEERPDELRFYTKFMVTKRETFEIEIYILYNIYINIYIKESKEKNHPIKSPKEALRTWCKGLNDSGGLCDVELKLDGIPWL